MRLIFSIAAGIVLANLAWECLLSGAHLAGRIVTRTIIDAARLSASRSQSTPAVQPIATVQTDEPDGRDIRFLEAQAQAREQRRAS